MDFFKEKFLPFIKANAIWVILALAGFIIAGLASEAIQSIGIILIFAAVGLLLFIVSNVVIFNLKYTRRMFTDNDGKIDTDSEKRAGGIIIATTYIGAMIFVAITALAVYIAQFSDTIKPN